MIKDLSFIERNLNGYIDLDSYLLEKYGSVAIKNNSDINRDSNIIIITINNAIYYFKSCSKEEAFKEMLADKMLEYLGIEHACYDLACINGEYGVISPNFKDSNYNYISGDDLIYEYYNENNLDKKEFNFDKFNNLIDVWNLLEIRYNCYPNKEVIVKNIMYNLNEKFMFDIITCQWDGASYNWMIAENSSYAKLAPVYDNQKMLDGLDYDKNKNLNIKVDEFNQARTEYDNLVELKKYLNYSSEEFVQIFKNMFKSLTPANIKWMLITIESELIIKIPHKIKESILARYTYNYNQIEKILEEELSKKR